MRVKKNKFHLAAQVVAVFLHEFNDSLIRLVHEQEWYLVLHLVDHSTFAISSRHFDDRLIYINSLMNKNNWDKYFSKESYEALCTDLIIEFKVPYYRSIT